MSDVLIRSCRRENLAQLRGFVEQMYQEDFSAHGGTPDIELTFKDLSLHPDKGQLLVFEYEQKVIGYAIIILFWSNEYRGNIIDIDELFISPHYRGMGFGSKFFKWLSETFSHNCVGWSLQVAHTNERAAVLYERLGFVTSRNRHLLKIFPVH
jgi:ribosomal protein S18 acetylase RimI-like enzyme